ncbi:MAG: hypothetical protein ABJB11_04800 [Ferruginibacter sp.]
MKKLMLFAVILIIGFPKTHAQITANKKEANTFSLSGAVIYVDSNDIIIKNTTHHISKPGKHTIKYWLVDPGVVLQKIVLHFGDLKKSYLGPPETKN